MALRPGIRLRPQDVGVAAALGCATLEVFRPLEVALFSTGDELREPGASLGPSETYDANRPILLGLLRALGCRVTDFGILPDRAEAVAEALSQAAIECDALITRAAPRAVTRTTWCKPWAASGSCISGRSR